MYNAQVCECKIFYYAKYISGLMLCEMWQATSLVQCKFIALPQGCYGIFRSKMYNANVFECKTFQYANKLAYTVYAF